MNRRAAAILFASVALSIAACASGGAASQSSAAEKTNSNVITMAEINSATFRDAYDIVQRLRPTWLTKARASSNQTLGGAAYGGTQASSGVGLLVYLDNTRLGGTEALRDLSATSIESLQFMDAATATAKLPGIGSSVISGAIVAKSRSGR